MVYTKTALTKIAKIQIHLHVPPLRWKWKKLPHKSYQRESVSDVSPGSFNSGRLVASCENFAHLQDDDNKMNFWR